MRFIKGPAMFKKILFIFVFGLVLRLSYVLCVPQISATIGDGGHYVFIANSLIQGNGYVNLYGKPEAHWPPGYPFFLSAIFKIFGNNYTAVRIVQSILSGLLTLIVFILGRKIFNPKTGLLASIITCFYPAFISYPGLLCPQSLAVFLIPFFIVLVINFQKKTRTALILGLLAGYIILLRPETLLLFLAMFGMIFFVSKIKKTPVFTYLFTVFVALSFVVFLWTYRNYRVFNKPILISTHYADQLWLSTWSGEWLEWQEKEPLVSILKGRPNSEAINDLLNAGIDNVKEHPFIYLRMCTKRLYRLWLTGHSNTFYCLADSLSNYFLQKKYFAVFIKFIMLLFNVIMVLLGFCGIWLAYRKSSPKKEYINYITMPIFFYVIFHFFIWVTPRYSVPVMPFIIIFASYSILYFWELIVRLVKD